jgi:hypothetical protein
VTLLFTSRKPSQPNFSIEIMSNRFQKNDETTTVVRLANIVAPVPAVTLYSI